MRRLAHLGLVEERVVPARLTDRITTHFSDAEACAGAAASEASLWGAALLRFDGESSEPLAPSLIDADQVATSRIEAATPGDESNTLCLKPCTSCARRRCRGRCIRLASHNRLALHACYGHRLPANFNTLTFEERRNCPRSSLMANVDNEDLENSDEEADVGSQMSPGG
jgi:hypothetical protein